MPRIHARALLCPNCGAPAKVQPGITLYECTFCKTSFEVEGLPPEPPPAPPPPPEIVVVAPGAGGGRLRGRSSSGGCFGAIFFLALIGGGVYFAMQAGLFGWNGKTPLVCGGNDYVNASNVTASFPGGVAVTATGNCEVHLKDSNLQGRVAVKTTENGEVLLDHGTITGTEAAIELHDTGLVNTDRTDVNGPKLDARPKDRTWNGQGPVICSVNDHITLRNVTVRVGSGAALILNDNCTATFNDCHIEGPVGAVVNGNATLNLNNCQLKARSGVYARGNAEVYIDKGTFAAEDTAVDATDNARVEAKKATVSGSTKTGGNASYRSD